MRNQKVSTGLGTIVLVIIAITVGVFTWVVVKNREVAEAPQNVVSVKKPVATQAPAEKQNNQVVQNEGAKTNKYVSKVYGFEFEYSQNSVITSNSTDSSIVVSDSPTGHWAYTINITPNSNSASLESAFSSILKQSVKPIDTKDVIISDIIINGKLAKRFLDKNSHDYGNAGVVLINGKNIVAIYGDDSTPTNKMNFEKILDSFKFTE